MKKLYSFVLTWFLLINAFSQHLPFQVMQEGGKLYILHTVAAKENWYSIGRMYNASPKDIAPFNHTTLDKGLSIGQDIKIPLTTSNFLQSGQPAADEVVLPVYHSVKEKENLYRIGQQYNKVSADQLKSWNSLPSDEVSKDVSLVVGYLKVKKSLSSLASSGQAKVGNVATAPVAKTPAPKPTATEEKKQDKPVVTTQETAAAPPPAVKKTEPVAAPVQTSVSSTDGGAFRSVFDEQVKAGSDKENINGQAAIFKSTSGWKDAKYYALMNKVLPGTIILVTNPQNNKFVYAKVLGEIPPGKENEGLAVRISNAAAAELLLAETGRYELQLSWAKQ